MKEAGRGLLAFVLVLLAVGGLSAALWLNAGDDSALVPVMPTEVEPTGNPDVIAQLLRRNFGSEVTVVPTIAGPQIRPTVPIIARPAASAEPISAAALQNPDENTTLIEVVLGATPTQALDPVEVAVRESTRVPQEWSPPALTPPLSLDPLGRDHYFFYRPVESNANNRVLLTYGYGSDGSTDEWPIHHGIDMPNPQGEFVYAAGSGVVRFASDGRSGAIDVFQTSQGYGNVVFIEHDFGTRDGEKLYTLYAHLQGALVRTGDRVSAGDPIALVGSTGTRSSGPHVHFEVRVGGDRYGDTRNPILWMVPYVGHGVIAGSVTDEEGEFIDNVTVSVRSRRTGYQTSTAETYRFAGTVNDVNPDPLWQENFAVADVPVGEYNVIANVDGVRLVRSVTVREGMTTFVELSLQEDPTEETDDDGSGQN